MDRREGEAGAPSVLSWETVVEEGNTPTPGAVAPAPTEPVIDTAQTSIPPLSLDPLPSAQNAAVDEPTEASAPVLGGLHLDLPPLSFETAPESPQPEAAPTELEIAPFDMPDFSLGSRMELPVRQPGGSLGSAPTTETPAVAPTAEAPAVAAAPPMVAEPAPAPAPAPAFVPEPTPAPEAAPAPVAPAPIAAAPAPVAPAPVAPAPAPVAPAPVAPATAPVAPAPAPVAAVVPEAAPIAAPAPAPVAPEPVAAAPVADLGAVQAAAVAAPPTVSLPQHQPSQAVAPAPSPLAQVPAKEPAAARKQKKRKQKQLKQKKSAGSGLALFFTLLVLVALIVAAIVFGRPYLFPDQWDDESRPYGEAIEAARGMEFGVPVSVERTATAAFDVTMADQLLGEWESELPTWRSLGLADGNMDAPLLRNLVEGWQYAFYSPQDGVVYADDALSPAAVDGAIAEGVAAAAYDEETGWSTRLDDSLLDFSAVTRAQAIATARTSAAQTSFGPAIAPERQIAVAAFLPPVLEYRVNAPVAFAELVPDSNVTIDPLIEANQLAPSTEPLVAEGDTIVAIRPQIDRSFWYLVFAAYTDAPTAYGASNALVQSTLATADRAGQTCSYGTFSGSDVDGTQRISNVLNQWVANSPAEFGAGLTVLEDGTLQLVSCDPGVGFESRARFGVARELARWRSVELAAVANIDPITGTNVQRQAEIDRVRASGVGIELMGLPFDTDAATTAELARAAATPVPQPAAAND